MTPSWGSQWGHGVPKAWHRDVPSPTEAHPTLPDHSARGWEENWVSCVTMEMLKEMLKQRWHSPALQNPLKINQTHHPHLQPGMGLGG